MDQNLRTSPNPNQHHKNITKLLLSLSIFFFFSYSSWFSSHLSLLSHTLDKNCIFLLFNGLVVFLAKTSGLISSSSKHKALDHHHLHGSEPEFMFFDIEAPLLDKEVSPNTTTEAFIPDSNTTIFIPYKETNMANSDECVIEEDEERETLKLILEEEEEESLNEEEEELNKKFDDFIRKMKEELRVEAQQGLIMV